VDLTEFLGEFQAEAGEKLDAIAGHLLRLERDTTDPRPVREMFLAAHTIKGGAAMMRLTQVEAVAHALEDLLSSFRDGRRALDGAAADLLFQAIDRLRELIVCATAAAVGGELEPSVVEFVAQLRGEPRAVPQTPKRALVVDDSATVRELHRLLLEDAGYQVEVRTSSDVTDRFDLIVAGLQGGLEVASTIGRDTPVLLTAAEVTADLQRRAVECGARALVRRGSLRGNPLRDELKRPGL
jgi:chemotaxis protein histidine kinase CheA